MLDHLCCSHPWYKYKHDLIADEKGVLGVLEYGDQIGFDIKRVFYLKNVNNHAVRGEHSHEQLKQILICLSGSFTIDLDSGLKKQTIEMKAGYDCLFVDGKYGEKCIILPLIVYF